MNVVYSFANVPSEVLIMILSYAMDGKKDAERLGKLATVCKSFKKASEDTRLWMQVAKKYIIPIDESKVLVCSVKEQIKIAIPRANEAWKRIIEKTSSIAGGSLSKFIPCRSLATYPFQNMWCEALYKNCLVIKDESLSEDDMRMLLLQIKLRNNTERQ